MSSIIMLLCLAPLLVIDLFFIVEVSSGLRKIRTSPIWDSVGKVTIVIPAHNEELGLRRMLGRLRRAAAEGTNLLVVADNCIDGTADVSRSAGVQVIERNDASHRGKGFALAFARDHLRADPPDAVVVMDADCYMDASSLAALIAACQNWQRPAQAVYLMEPSPSANAVIQLSNFAFLVKNLVRQRGLQRLSGGIHLTGTGMAFPWKLFERADLATSHIVEDIRLGLELSHAGHHPRLVDGSYVWSTHADQSATLEQRSRWEGGFLTFARAVVPKILRRGVRERSLMTIATGLDLLVPPLALLSILNIAALTLSVILAGFGVISWLPAGIIATVGLGAAIVLAIVWWREGKACLSFAAILRLPLYAFWKVPMYFRLARFGAPKEWRRTERDNLEGD